MSESKHANPLSGNRFFYLCIRRLHLYLGLFVSPYVVLFALSTIALNHSWGLGEPAGANQQKRRTVLTIRPPAGESSLERAQDILKQLGLSGEIGYVNHLPREGKLVFPVMKPGLEARVEVDLQNLSAAIKGRETTLWEKLAYLHKSPGPHNANIRGNWIYTRWWKVLVDSVVYALLFLATGGVYLWLVIRAERKAGLVSLGLGTVCFVLIAAVLSL